MSRYELNLIPAEVLIRLRSRRRLRAWIRIGVPLLLLLGIARLELGFRIVRAEDRIELHRKKQEALELKRASLSEMFEERDRLARELETLSSLSPGGSLLEVFMALSEAMPGDVYLRSLSATPVAAEQSDTRDRGGTRRTQKAEIGLRADRTFALQMEGRASSTDQLASFLFRLSNRDDISDTRLRFSKHAGEDTSQGVSFGVDAKFHPRRSG